MFDSIANNVIATSNVRGPSRPIPIPKRPKVDDKETDDGKEESTQDGRAEIVCEATGGKEDREGFVSTFFGMAAPGPLPIMFTIFSYNGYCRVGLITNEGTIEDPEVLMQCFMDEWKEYEAKFDAERTEEV